MGHTSLKDCIFADIALQVAFGMAEFEAQCTVVLGLLLAGLILTPIDPLLVDFCFCYCPSWLRVWEIGFFFAFCSSLRFLVVGLGFSQLDL